MAGEGATVSILNNYDKGIVPRICTYVYTVFPLVCNLRGGPPHTFSCCLALFVKFKKKLKNEHLARSIASRGKIPKNSNFYVGQA